MNKKLHAILAGAAIALITTSAQAEIKIALDSPPNMERAGSYVWAHTFAEHLKSKGMKVKEYARGSLGGEAEKLDQVSQGLLEVSMSDVKSAGKIDKLVFGVALPYLFSDVAHMDRALAAGDLLDKVNASVTKSGVRILAITTVGPGTGVFNTEKPVYKAADLSDLRMRALDEAQIALFKSWGSTGTIVSWKEVPNALQTGVAICAWPTMSTSSQPPCGHRPFIPTPIPNSASTSRRNGTSWSNHPSTIAPDSGRSPRRSCTWRRRAPSPRTSPTSRTKNYLPTTGRASRIRSRTANDRRGLFEFGTAPRFRNRRVHQLAGQVVEGVVDRIGGMEQVEVGG